MCEAHRLHNVDLHRTLAVTQPLENFSEMLLLHAGCANKAEVYQAFAEMTARQQSRQLAPSEQDDIPAAQPKEKDNQKQEGRLPCHQKEPVEEEQKPSRSAVRIAEGGNAEKERSAKPPEVRDADYDTFLDRSIWDGPSSNEGDIDNNHYDRDENGETGGNVPKPDASPLSIAPSVETQAIYAEDDDGVATYVPAPRASTGVVPVGFTPRIFPTPLRESKMADESAWIMKNRRHLHRNKALVGRLPKSPGPGDQPFDISESDPVWLKSRGDDLYRGGDFLAAVNAYTSALDADPKAFACLSNRAACYLRLGKYSECTADCGAALGILQTLPETGLIQARVLSRRALAQRELGHYRLSLEDFRAALDFHPRDPALLQEIKRAEPLAQCETAKKEAVKRFASGDVEGACELYTAALAAVPASPSCLSNRAACHLALRRPQDCIRDCNTVLELLSADPLCSYHAENNSGGDALVQKTLKPPPGSVPKAGSDKRRQWVLTTLLRRGRASVELGHLENALKDYRDASSLAPEDGAVERDVRELERRVDEAVSSRH